MLGPDVGYCWCDRGRPQRKPGAGERDVLLLRRGTETQPGWIATGRATFIGRSLISQTSTRRRWTRALRATAWRQHSRIRPVRASPMRSRRPSTSAARRSKPSAFRLAVLCRQLLRPELLQPQPGLGVDGLLGRSTGWRFTEWLRCDGARLCPHAPKLNAPAPPADTSPNAGRTGRSSMATSCAPVKVVPEHCWHGQGDERTGGCPKRDVLRELRDHPHLHQLCPGYQRDHGDPPGSA